jgi:hypothetical protein
LTCDEHGAFFGTTLPPGVADNRSIEEVARIAILDAQQDLDKAHTSVCFHCWGRINGSLVLEPPVFHPRTGDVLIDRPFSSDEWDILSLFDCERCGTVFWVPPESCLVRHPAIVSFYHDHGIDLRRGPSSGGKACVSSDCTVKTTDPVRVRVDTRIDNEKLRVTLDEDIQVVAVERSRTYDREVRETSTE